MHLPTPLLIMTDFNFPIFQYLSTVVAPIVDIVVGDVVIGGDQTKEWSRETELLIKEIPCANTQFFALVPPKIIILAIEGNQVGDATSLKSANVTAGWKNIDDQ